MNAEDQNLSNFCSIHEMRKSCMRADLMFNELGSTLRYCSTNVWIPATRTCREKSFATVE